MVARINSFCVLSFQFAHRCLRKMQAIIVDFMDNEKSHLMARLTVMLEESMSE